MTLLRDVLDGVLIAALACAGWRWWYWKRAARLNTGTRPSVHGVPRLPVASAWSVQ